MPGQHDNACGDGEAGRDHQTMAIRPFARTPDVTTVPQNNNPTKARNSNHGIKEIKTPAGPE